jgi:hypothetical protein
MRPKGVEATAEERAYACLKMEDVRNWLTTEWRFPEPIVVMSGNGYYLKYRVDLPASPCSAKIQALFLSILDAKYTDERVEIDTRMWDLPRICQVAGTYSRKGIPTEERPQRLAYTVSRPDVLEVINAARLQQFIAAHPDLVEEAIAAETKRYEREYRQYTTQRDGTGDLTVEEAHARVQEWCQRYSILYHIEYWGGCAFYFLDRCLFLEASKTAHAHGVTEHNEGHGCFICVWEQEKSTGKPGMIGAGDPTSWRQEVMRDSGLWGWELLKRLADPEYAIRAEEWDKQREKRSEGTEYRRRT